MYIYKDDVVKVIYGIDELNEYLSNGWKRGVGKNRKPRRKKSLQMFFQRNVFILKDLQR